MIESRDLSELLPIVERHAKLAIAATEELTGLKLIITCTYRDQEKQKFYYDQGRTTPGKIITHDDGHNLGPHQLRVALDIAPAIQDSRGTHLFYSTDKWNQIAECFIKEGFEWGGDWKTFQDKPHFQFTQNQTLAQIRSGMEVTDSMSINNGERKFA
jgi:peptidoglycan LD-endopeptidase CwlK